MKNLLILGGANGAENIGDDSMFEHLICFIKSKLGKAYIVTDGRDGWSNKNVNKVLPYLHKTHFKISYFGKFLNLLRFFYSGFASKIFVKYNLNSFDPLLNLYMNTIKKSDLIIFA